MAITPIRIKRSSVPGKAPTPEQLKTGELALNLYDGTIFFKQEQGSVGVGTRVVAFGVGSYLGKTIFVTTYGNDLNSGLNEQDAKGTIKGAAALALPGDTIKVYPGVYVEDNPIVLNKTVSVEGTELRNCVITPKNPSRDLFYVNNGCHITDVSFIGPEMSDGAAVVALQPLLGTSANRYFDASRLIRLNLDFIASEAVGYITSTSYRDPAFQIPGGLNDRCAEDIKLIFKSICYDITRGGNSKSVEAGKFYYDNDGLLQHIVGVNTETIDAIYYAADVAKHCINNVTWTGNHQNEYTQIKDLSMQNDPDTGSNQDIGSCANVISAVYSCVGIVTSIIENGLSILGTGPGQITTRYPGNAGIGFTTVLGITSAVYTNTSGRLTINVPELSARKGDIIEIRDLLFECSSSESGISTQRFPSGNYGYEFYIDRVNPDGTYDLSVGLSTISHTYVSGGIVVDRSLGVTTANYDNITGIVTITAPGIYLETNDFVGVRDLEFSCSSGAGTTTIYPTGNSGYDFRVLSVVDSGTPTATFSVNVGTSTITHTYVSGGKVYSPYSRGSGPITQGPYVRNATNFIPKSIGMKIDGFDAEPGDKTDTGVTGSMSVDSYTQYNQAGIGVSITNGAYAQLVSIFNICNDIAIFTGSGGQCDITNSNASFGRLGLVADGVGNNVTKSIYRSTGIAHTDAEFKSNQVVVSGVGNQRPYDGLVCYFGDLYFIVNSLRLTNPGFGYASPPKVTFSAPEGENGILPRATTTLDETGRVVAINLIGNGSQYLNPPSIIIDPPPGVGVQATAEVASMQPFYYNVSSATLPSAGISTITFLQNLNNTVSAGTTVYFSRLSLQIASSHSFEWVGSGTDINTAKPALGGVVIQENEVVQENGGLVIYTSTDQAGNFRIGDGVIINQATGTITGGDFSKALFTQITPFVLALTD